MAQNFKRVNMPSLVRKYREFSYSPFSISSHLDASDLKGVTAESLAEADKLCEAMLPRMSTTYTYLVRQGRMYYRRSNAGGTNMPFQGVGYILLADSIASFLLSSGSRGRILDVAFDYIPSTAAVAGVRNIDAQGRSVITEKVCLDILASIHQPFALHDEKQISEVYAKFIKTFVSDSAKLSSDHTSAEYIAYLVAQRFARLCLNFFDSMESSDAKDGVHEFTISLKSDEHLSVPSAGDEDFGSRLSAILKHYHEWHAFVGYLDSMSVDAKVAFTVKNDRGNVFVTLTSEYYHEILKSVVNSLVRPIMALSSYLTKFDERYKSLKQYLVHSQLLSCVEDTPLPKNCLYGLLSPVDVDNEIATAKTSSLTLEDLRLACDREREQSGPLADDFEQLIQKLYYTAEIPFADGFRVYKTFINGQQKIYRLDYKGRKCYSLSIGSYHGNSVNDGLTDIDTSKTLSGTVESELSPVIHETARTEFMGVPSTPGRSFQTRDGVMVSVSGSDLMELRKERKRSCETLIFDYDPLTGSIGVKREYNAFNVYPPSEGPDFVAYGDEQHRREALGLLFECRKVDVESDQTDLLDVILALPARFVQTGDQTALRDLYVKQTESLGSRLQPTWGSYECRILEHNESSYKLSWLMMSSDPDVRSIAARNERLIFLPFDTDPVKVFNKKDALNAQLLFPAHVRVPRYSTYIFSVPRAFVSPFVLEMLDVRGSFRTNDAQDGEPRCKITVSDDPARVNVAIHLDCKTDFVTGDRKMLKDPKNPEGDTYQIGLRYDDIVLRQLLASHKNAFAFIEKQVIPWTTVTAFFDSPVFQSGFVRSEDAGAYLMDLVRTFLFISQCTSESQEDGRKPLAMNSAFIACINPISILAEICDVTQILSELYDLNKLRIASNSGFGYAHLGDLVSLMRKLGLKSDAPITSNALITAGVTIERADLRTVSKKPFSVDIFTFSSSALDFVSVLSSFFQNVSGESFEHQFTSVGVIPVIFDARHEGFFRRVSQWRLPVFRAPTFVDSVNIDTGAFQKEVGDYLRKFLTSYLNCFYTSAITGCIPEGDPRDPRDPVVYGDIQNTVSSSRNKKLKDGRRNKTDNEDGTSAE